MLSQENSSITGLLPDTPSALGGIPGNATILLLKKMGTVMFKKNTLLRALIAAGLTSGLVACGGGSSGTSSTDSTTDSPSGGGNTTGTVNDGTFIDSPVGGLEYTAQPSGIEGFTTDDGGFRYQEGDTIRFKVGNFEVGSVEASGVISPKSIGLNNEDAVANIAQFLQTLDDDGILENGITINNSARDLATNASGGNIADMDLSSSAVAENILALTKKNSVSRVDLVDRTEALGHLNETLANFEAASIASCSDDAPAVENSRIADKTFGRIAQGEITLFTFEAEGNRVVEIANDAGESKNNEGTWALDGQAKTITFNWGGDEEIISLCDAENSIILESGDTSNKFYDVINPSAEPGDAFLLSYVGMSDGQGALIQLTGETGYERGTGNNPAQTGTWGQAEALELDGSDKIYFLKGQNNRIGIHVDTAATTSTILGTATAIPLISEPGTETFAGNSFLLRNEQDNTVDMIEFTSSTDFIRYTNENAMGEQEALYSEGTWVFQNQRELTLTVDGGLPQTLITWDAGNLLFVAEKNTNNMTRLYKTQPILEDSFTGDYNVNIPTENVVNNRLLVNEDKTCSYDGTACQWTTNANGHAVVTFPGRSEQGHIWQIAGRSSSFGFVMVHDNQTDIEPGFMTRQ